MDAYMRENNIEVVPAAPGTRKKATDEPPAPAGEAAPAKKDGASSEPPARPKGSGKQA
jgi:hypothetical protein